MFLAGPTVVGYSKRPLHSALGRPPPAPLLRRALLKLKVPSFSISILNLPPPASGRIKAPGGLKHPVLSL